MPRHRYPTRGNGSGNPPLPNPPPAAHKTWCARHWQPYQSGEVSGMIASMMLMEWLLKDEAFMRACGYAPEKNTPADSTKLESAIRQFEPVCCYFGDAQMLVLLETARQRTAEAKARVKSEPRTPEGLVDVQAITSARLADWGVDCVRAHATPILLLGVGHDHANGELHLVTLEDKTMDRATIVAFLKRAIDLIEGGAVDEQKNEPRE